MELIDLGFTSPKFTWHGTRNNSLVQERLDRGLVNDPGGMWTKNLFKFEAFWCKESGCKEIIERTWNMDVEGSWLNKWHKKIQATKRNLKRWSDASFRGRKNEIASLSNHLGRLQVNWGVKMDDIKEITENINKLEEQKEQFWLQRSRVRWLKQSNHIGRLQNASGNWTDDLSGIWRVVKDHFLRLFSMDESRCWGDILECVDPIVTAEINVALGKPVDKGEIREASTQMGRMKADGLDGFQRVFFQNF
ncbi:hypothetical protein ACFX1Q_003175 [Malus domestica]